MRDPAESDEYADFFDPHEYLRQYYSLPQLAQDDARLFQSLTAWLKQQDRMFATALDLGCGPTIHNTFAIAPYVQHLDLADYLPANLAEIRHWLDDAPDAHNWDPLFRGVLQCQGVDANQLPARKALFRARIGKLRHCDLHWGEPLGEPMQYDLVTSFFCVECVADSTEQWQSFMSRLLGLVRPGGAIFLAAVRNAERYRVLGRWFRTVPINEYDLKQIMIEHGFSPPLIHAQAVPAPDWADDGFDHICLVSATRH
ncbi:MAG: guanitoxin biosynthesis pre-guanitoxin forming N-methyltransferase GntF [Planctomycetaceae bacterium]